MSQIQEYQDFTTFSSICDKTIPFSVQVYVENDYALFTVQSNGLYLYHIPSKLNLASWSVSPQTTFACPSKFIHTTQPSGDLPSFIGYVYAVLLDSNKIGRKSKCINMWRNDPQNLIQQAKSNKPDITKMVHKSIVDFSILSEFLVLVHEDGTISFSDPDLSIFKEIKNFGSINLSSNHFLKTEIGPKVSQVSNNHEVRQGIIMKEQGQLIINSESSQILKFTILVPTYYDFSNDLMFVHHDKLLKSFKISNGSPVSEIPIPFDNGLLSYLSLDNSYFLCVGSFKNTTKLVLFETNYGTIQHSIDLPGNFDSFKLSSFENLEQGKGAFIIASSSQTNRFDTTVFTVSFHTEPITVNQIIGKRKFTLEYMIKESSLKLLKLSEIESNLTKINSNQQETASFCMEFSKLKTPNECSTSFFTWLKKNNIQDLNTSALNLIVDHLSHNKIWSHDIITFILKNAPFISCPALLQFIIKNKDSDLLTLAVTRVELQEQDLVDCIKFATTLLPIPRSNLLHILFDKKYRKESMISNLKTLNFDELVILLNFSIDLFPENTIKAIQIVSLLIDAHFSQLIVSSTLHPAIEKLFEMVKSEVKSDLMVPMNFPLVPKLNAVNSPNRERYMRMVNDAQASSIYCIQTIQF